jgi:phospholipid/cholesterol/gamma-HCH transport system substrate-binding protein
LRFGYDVRVTFPEAAGANVGSDVFLAGKRIGRIAEIRFTGGNPKEGVTLTGVIDRDVNVPGDVNAYIRSKGIMGGVLVEFRSDGLEPGRSRTDPGTGGPLQWLPKDGSVTIPGQARLDLGLLPPEVTADIRQTMVKFNRLADTLETFLAPPQAPTMPMASAPATVPPNIHATLAKLDAALEAVNQVLGNPENQSNLRVSLANLAAATAKAGEAMTEAKALMAKATVTVGDVSGAAKSASARFDELASRLIDDANRMGEVLTELDRAAVRINQGQGTAGKLINDPALYNNLVDITSQMKNTLLRFQELLDAWKKEGMKIKF